HRGDRDGDRDRTGTHHRDHHHGPRQLTRPGTGGPGRHPRGIGGHRHRPGSATAVTTVDQLAALRTPAGEAALTAAATLVGDDPLTAATALRAQGVAPDLAAAALTQATLRTRAVAKFGPDAHRMFFTRPGLEQATRAVVAARRAARLAAAGVRHLADLGCGIGADTIACAQAGLQVTAVEADPATAAVAAANLAALGLTDRATVHAGR